MKPTGLLGCSHLFAQIPGFCYTNPAMPPTPEHLTPGGRYNARVGIVLFLIYLVVYAVFVGLSAFAPDVMKNPVLAGVSLAVVYGFGLIILAFALALLYMALCRPENDGGRL